MLYSTQNFQTRDNKEVVLFVWDKVINPKAVLKIAHGMAEHSKRYSHFAYYLNSMGYVVVMNDERGHGETAKDGILGHDDGDVFSNNVFDQIDICKWCKEQWNLPVFLMGHSYGSFLTQSVMTQSPDSIDGYVLSGSNFMKGITYSLCGFLAKQIGKKHGESHPAELIAKLSFGSYSKKFKGKNNWLTRDETVVKKYNSDPLCGFVCSAGFYHSFMTGIRKCYKKERWQNINKSKPLLIVSGSDDPVGEYSKGVNKLFNFYKKKVGLTNVDQKIFFGARHEILNELAKEHVYETIEKWIAKQLEK